jgi:hypothetical protein
MTLSFLPPITISSARSGRTSSPPNRCPPPHPIAPGFRSDLFSSLKSKRTRSCSCRTASSFCTSGSSARTGRPAPSTTSSCSGTTSASTQRRTSPSLIPYRPCLMHFRRPSHELARKYPCIHILGKPVSLPLARAHLITGRREPLTHAGACTPAQCIRVSLQQHGVPSYSCGARAPITAHRGRGGR